MCAKMGQLHAELSEQAAELGFETVQDAFNSGYTVDYDKRKLVKSSVLWHLDADECLVKEQEKAHEAWLKERDEVLGGLLNLMVHNVYDYDTVIKAYNFIKEQCHD